MVEELNQLIVRSHDMRLTTSFKEPGYYPNDGDHVSILYSDGELVYTKGGCLFGRRSHHLTKSKYSQKFEILDQLRFPLTLVRPDGTYGYMICTDENGAVLREKMDGLVGVSQS